MKSTNTIFGGVDITTLDYPVIRQDMQAAFVHVTPELTAAVNRVADAAEQLAEAIKAWMAAQEEGEASGLSDDR
jgi:hypothetical protein